MVRSMIFVALLFFVFPIDLSSQPGSNLQLVGQLRTRGTSQYSNCWGYVSPGGKEYAIVGTASGTQIVDISTDTLKEIAFISGPNSAWREMKVYQKYAYVVTEGNGAGLQIIDLDSLKLVNTITTTQIPSGHTISIEGKYLYISGSRYKAGGIVVFDLTNPVQPVFAGEYQASYIHDCFIKNDTIYAAAIYGIGLDIIDATNKSDLKRIKLVNYPFAGTHNTDVSQDGKYVFTTDEINNDPGRNGNIVRVWDKSDINNVSLVGSYVAKPNTIAHNIHIKGKYGFVAHYTEGVRVIDVENPEIPFEVAYYDTYSGSANNTIGNWGVFPYYQSDKIIATDMNGGLFVFKFPGQNSGIPVARSIVTVIDSVTNMPIENVLVELAGSELALRTDAQGRVKFGSLNDTVTITLSQSSFSAGYFTKNVKVVMPFGSTGTMTVKMKKLPTGGLLIKTNSALSTESLSGVKIRIQNTTIEGFSNSAGEFNIPSLLSGMSYRIVVSKFGFSVDSVNVIADAEQTKTVTVSLQHNPKDNFSHDLGWIVGSTNDSGTAGRWQRSVPKPIILFGDTLQPPFGHGGINDVCYVTGPTNTLSDNVEGRTTLTSPSFSLTAMSNPVILYWIFINTMANPVDDTLYVRLSNDNGITWHTVETISGKYPRWTQHRISVNSFMTPGIDMKIRFVARDGGSPTVFNVAVDDIEFGNDLQLSVRPHESEIPFDISLLQNYPNPFNPTTKISYQIPGKNNVSLKVYDMLGKEVATLFEGVREAGYFEHQFDAGAYSSGVYFYQIALKNDQGKVKYFRKKMVLLK